MRNYYLYLLLLLAGTCPLSACGPLNRNVIGAHPAGLAEQPIVTGSEPDRGDPSVVAIFAHPANSARGSLCTGTVISPRAVLTAAHCVHPSIVGPDAVFDVYTGMNLGAATSRLPVDFVDFDSRFSRYDVTAGHDIAVLRLAEPTLLEAVPLNRDGLGNDDLGAAVRVVGYGSSSQADTSTGTKRTVTTSIAAISSKLVKIGDSDEQTCQGDSGGPAFRKIDGIETLIGVTSFGMDRSSNSVCFGGGYDTRVDQYVAFIDEHLWRP